MRGERLLRQLVVVGPASHRRDGAGANENDAVAKYHQLFLKAQQTYIDKLWNGAYFRYDTDSEYRDSVQADQLAGQWYANMTGPGDLVPREMQLAAARKIFDFNVMKFGEGNMGAANGMAADGSIIRDKRASPRSLGRNQLRPRYSAAE